MTSFSKTSCEGSRQDGGRLRLQYRGQKIQKRDVLSFSGRANGKAVLLWCRRRGRGRITRTFGCISVRDSSGSVHSQGENASAGGEGTWKTQCSNHNEIIVVRKKNIKYTLPTLNMTRQDQLHKPTNLEQTRLNNWFLFFIIVFFLNFQDTWALTANRCQYAPCSLLFAQAYHFVARTARLERPRVLLVFALQETQLGGLPQLYSYWKDVHDAYARSGK